MSICRENNGSGGGESNPKMEEEDKSIFTKMSAANSYLLQKVAPLLWKKNIRN